MRTLISLVSIVLFSLSTAVLSFAKSEEMTQKKEWTFLVFMNGFNNLDYFTHQDLNEMEKVGSTDQINVVVQWASWRRGTVQRLRVEKDQDPYNVTSPVLDEIGRADMGDYRTLIDFVKWAKVHYPAKKYFIDIWNHGSGWRKLAAPVLIQDISSDDFSGNQITTEQLGIAMKEISADLGQKVDIYGSDACLMAMIEVAGEMKESVNVYLGSQDLEPGAGWPYDSLLEEWSKNPKASAEEVASLLVQKYVDSYPGQEGITQSAFRMSEYSVFVDSLKNLALDLKLLSAQERNEIRSVMNQVISYYLDDYKDLGQFVDELSLKMTSVKELKTVEIFKNSLNRLIIKNLSSPDLKNASGVSIWLPTSKRTYQNYSSRYQALAFNQDTQWLDFLTELYP